MQLDNLVDDKVYKAVAKAASEEFAFSYLAKAKQNGMRITPYTFIAWKRLTANRNAMQALHDCRIVLVRPEPWTPNRDRTEISRQAA